VKNKSHKSKTICLECKWHTYEAYKGHHKGHHCHHPSLGEQDVISGRFHYPKCSETNDGKCQHFEQRKKNIFERFFG